MATTKKVNTNSTVTFPHSSYQLFFTVIPLLTSVYREISELSKKKPDGALSTFKVKNINKLIESARKLLVDSDMITYLENIDDAQLPTYSDTAMIIAQYLQALRRFRASHITYDGGTAYWRTTEGNFREPADFKEYTL